MPTPLEGRPRETGVEIGQSARCQTLLPVTASAVPLVAAALEGVSKHGLRLRLAGEEIGEMSLSEGHKRLFLLFRRSLDASPVSCGRNGGGMLE